MRLSIWPCLIATFAALIPAQLHAEMQPKAQEAVKKGLIAARQQEWDIAIQYFQQARKSAPDEPEIFGYLGLAESKIPGRELRAISWFGAYLAANPHPANEAAIKDAIIGLQIKTEGNIDRLITAVETAADALPDSPIKHDGGISGHETNKADQDRIGALFDVARLWATSGNADKAIETAHRIGAAGYNEQYAILNIISALAEVGHIQKAIKIATISYDAGFRLSTQVAIAKAEAKAGDLSGARQRLNAALQTVIDSKPDLRDGYVDQIYSAQIDVGDIIGAQEAVRLVQRPISKASMLVRIASAQAHAGDIAAARVSLTSAQHTVDAWNSLTNAEKSAQCKCKQTDDTENLADFENALAREQGEIGDIKGERATLILAERFASRITIPQKSNGSSGSAANQLNELRKRNKNSLMALISQEQASAGDIANAKRTVGSITEETQRRSAAAFIASLPKPDSSEVIAGRALKELRTNSSNSSAAPIISVADWTTELDRLNTPVFLDLSGSLKTPQQTLKTIYPGNSAGESEGESKKTFDALVGVARYMILTTNTVDQMLNRQFKHTANP